MERDMNRWTGFDQLPKFRRKEREDCEKLGRGEGNEDAKRGKEMQMDRWNLREIFRRKKRQNSVKKNWVVEKELRQEKLESYIHEKV